MKIILKNKGVFAAVIAAAVLLLIFVAGMIMTVAGGDKIYGGVKADGISLSGLTVEEATEKLSKEMPDGNFDGTVQLVLDGKNKTAEAADFVYGYSPLITAEEAYKVGRSGNFFTNTLSVLGARLGLKNVPLALDYDENTLDKIIDELMSDVAERVEEYSYEVKEDGIHINTGKPGLMPDGKKIAEEILETVKNGTYNTAIVFEKKERQPSPVDVDKLYREVCGEAENAEFVYSGKEVSVKPHKPGVDFNKSEAAMLVKTHSGAGNSFVIPAKVVMPEVLTKDREGKLFTDTLAIYTTQYNSGVVGRSKNVVLASELINGTILLPGDEFSYNDVVGERTAARGFATAAVYMDGESVDGIGGGICQVSSTLYCAVLYADLEVTERVNHQLTVGYVPLGQDATVDYGNIDFRFRNNTNYPVKISVSAGGGTVTVSLVGYKEDKSKTVVIENETVGYIEPVEKVEKDPTLPLGERKVEKVGSSGAVVNTYKSILINGEVKSRTKITESRYGAGKTLVREGTGEEVEPTESPAPEGAEAVTGTEAPVTTDAPTSETGL